MNFSVRITFCERIEVLDIYCKSSDVLQLSVSGYGWNCSNILSLFPVSVSTESVFMIPLKSIGRIKHEDKSKESSKIQVYLISGEIIHFLFSFSSDARLFCFLIYNYERAMKAESQNHEGGISVRELLKQKPQYILTSHPVISMRPKFSVLDSARKVNDEENPLDKFQTRQYNKWDVHCYQILCDMIMFQDYCSPYEIVSLSKKLKSCETTRNRQGYSTEFRSRKICLLNDILMRYFQVYNRPLQVLKKDIATFESCKLEDPKLGFLGKTNRRCLIEEVLDERLIRKRLKAYCQLILDQQEGYYPTEYFLCLSKMIHSEYAMSKSSEKPFKNALKRSEQELLCKNRYLWNFEESFLFLVLSAFLGKLYDSELGVWNDLCKLDISSLNQEEEEVEGELNFELSPLAIEDISLRQNRKKKKKKKSKKSPKFEFLNLEAFSPCEKLGDKEEEREKRKRKKNHENEREDVDKIDPFADEIEMKTLEKTEVSTTQEREEEDEDELTKDNMSISRIQQASMKRYVVSEESSRTSLFLRFLETQDSLNLSELRNQFFQLTEQALILEEVEVLQEEIKVMEMEMKDISDKIEIDVILMKISEKKEELERKRGNFGMSVDSFQMSYFDETKFPRRRVLIDFVEFVFSNRDICGEFGVRVNVEFHIVVFQTSSKVILSVKFGGLYIFWNEESQFVEMRRELEESWSVIASINSRIPTIFSHKQMYSRVIKICKKIMFYNCTYFQVSNEPTEQEKQPMIDFVSDILGILDSPPLYDQILEFIEHVTSKDEYKEKKKLYFPVTLKFQKQFKSILKSNGFELRKYRKKKKIAIKRNKKMKYVGEIFFGDFSSAAKFLEVCSDEVEGFSVLYPAEFLLVNGFCRQTQHDL